MTTTNTAPKELNSMAKVDEYKSVDGLRFRAKLMGNTVVEELRGKTVAEYAMAKLKLNIMKQKQHKTRVNISLKWDGFYVYLSDGGQELLHSFPLENISFVWKDPCDDRALGIICSDGISDKQTMATRFYGYKTEKLALPLIMSLKELFSLRANEQNDFTEEKPVSENGKTDKEASPSSIEDLLDLKVDTSPPVEINFNISSQSTTDATANWTSFSNVNLFSTFPPAQSFQAVIPSPNPSGISSGIPNVNTVTSMWQPYQMPENNSPNQPWNGMKSQSMHPYSNPFSQPIVYPPSNNFNVNIQNPFGIVTTTSMALPSVAAIQPTPPKRQPSKISRTNIDDLFSDLLGTDLHLDVGNPLRQFSTNSLTSSDKDVGKISLIDMKNRQEPKEMIDFSVFEKNSLIATNPGNSAASTISNQKIESNAMAIPLFQFD